MIYVIGLGPGGDDFLVPPAKKALSEATWVVGHPRQIESIHQTIANIHILDKKLSDLVEWIKEHQDKERIVVLASGDPMLYGIGKYLSEALGKASVTVISGISAIQYLFAKTNIDMNDLYITSSHGRLPDFDFVFKHPKVAMVTDQTMGPYEIAKEIMQRGLKRTLIIGENLSYPDETITVVDAEAVVNRSYHLNIVIIKE